MIDGNTYALNRYESQEQKFAHAEQLLNSSIEPLLQELEDLAMQIKYIVRGIEEDHGYDFGDEAKEAIAEAVRVSM